MVKNIPPSDMPQVRAKVAALTTLSGERKDWGVGRAWERDYLANVSQRCPDEMDTHTHSLLPQQQLWVEDDRKLLQLWSQRTS